SVAVAKDITSHYNNESILIICAGSSGQFCLVDFYVAGYLINELIKRTEDQKIELSDSAKSAKLFYRDYFDQAERILSQSGVRQMLIKEGFHKDIKFTSQKNIMNLVPKLNGHQIIFCKVKNHINNNERRRNS